MYTCILSLLDLHPSRSPQSIELQAPCTNQQEPTSYLFYTWKCPYGNPSLPVHSTTFTPCPPICFLCLCLYPALKKGSSLPFFWTHIYALIYDIYFSLSDFLHFVWQIIGPSTSLQMTQYHSSLCMSNIPLHICSTSSLSIHLLMDIYVASIVLVIVNNAAKNTEVHGVFLNYSFLRVCVH